MSSETTLNSALTIDGILIPVQPSATHEWTVTTSQAATGYGVSESALRNHKQRHSDELVEGKHFLSVTNCDAGNLTSEQTQWTKRGVIRLGFFIKSERAKKFRDAAEDLIIRQTEAPAVAVAGADVIAAVMPVLLTMAETLNKLVDCVARLESNNGPVPLCELTANPSALTERQTSVLHHLEFTARPLVELGLVNEVPVLNALERAGLARKTGTGWARVRKAA